MTASRYVVVVDHPELGQYHEVFASRTGAIKLANNNGFAIIIEVGGEIAWTNILAPHHVNPELYGKLSQDELPITLNRCPPQGLPAEDEPYDYWWYVTEGGGTVDPGRSGPHRS